MSAAEVEAVIGSLCEWARERPDIRALAVVGSWVRAAAGEGSDLDLVVLTEQVKQYAEADEKLPPLAAVDLGPAIIWGVLTERRLMLGTGLEVDLGFASPGWAAIAPVDAGTRRVVEGGMRILHDPDRLLARLAAACDTPGS